MLNIPMMLKSIKNYSAAETNGLVSIYWKKCKLDPVMKLDQS